MSFFPRTGYVNIRTMPPVHSSVEVPQPHTELCVVVSDLSLQSPGSDLSVRSDCTGIVSQETTGPILNSNQVSSIDWDRIKRMATTIPLSQDYPYEEKEEPHDINRIQKINIADIDQYKWIKCIIKREEFDHEVINKELQYILPYFRTFGKFKVAYDNDVDIITPKQWSNCDRCFYASRLFAYVRYFRKIVKLHRKFNRKQNWMLLGSNFEFHVNVSEMQPKLISTVHAVHKIRSYTTNMVASQARLNIAVRDIFLAEKKKNCRFLEDRLIEVDKNCKQALREKRDLQTQVEKLSSEIDSLKQKNPQQKIVE